MNGIKISKLPLVFLLFLFLFHWPHYAEENYRPLIYFSTQDDPNTDAALKKTIAEELKIPVHIPLVAGENRLNPFTLIILKGNPPLELPCFSEVYTLFKFFVRNSVHKNGPLIEYQIYNKQLFYQCEPIYLTCGKISDYFAEIVVNQLKFPRKYVRMIHLYNANFIKQDTAQQPAYIEGQHAVLEIYFLDLKSWVVFDLDKGVIGTLNDQPVSLFTLNQAKENEINLTPVGLDQYGKGEQSTLAVNVYYKEARHCFGFKKEKKFHALFTYESPEAKLLFCEIYIKILGTEPILYTSPETFYSVFYAKPTVKPRRTND